MNQARKTSVKQLSNDNLLKYWLVLEWRIEGRGNKKRLTILHQ